MVYNHYMPSLGIYYILSRKVADRWHRNHIFQKRALPAWENIPKMFVVDEDWDEPLPGEVIRTNCFTNGMIHFSRLKNLGLDWAATKNLDWVLHLDSDSLILKAPTVYPSSGYGILICYHSREGESDDAILAKYATRKGMIFDSCSMFMLRKDVYTKYRYDETIVGYGGEDLDYHKNILGKSGISQTRTDAHGVHLWHPMVKRERSGNFDRYLEKSGVLHAIRSSEKIEGWMLPEELRWLAEAAVAYPVIIEVGSWKGRSTKAMAAATKGTVYAIDNWSGSANPEDYTTIKVNQQGAIGVYREFLTNLSDEIASAKCRPLFMDSALAASFLKSSGLEADMIFIDGDHEYDIVKRDILLYRPLLRKGGLFCGHDYVRSNPGVIKAVNEFVAKPKVVAGSIWRDM